jgi:Mlc titration factor MtfA (ptsG expression regulator)
LNGQIATKKQWKMSIIKFWRRKRIRRRAFPEAWKKIARSNVAHYRHLSESYRKELEEIMMVFINEKRFEGCGGLNMTDEVRVTIAAQACLLLLGNASDYFPDLRTILVYPDSYIASVEHRTHDNTIVEGDEHRSGEAWNMGSIVLSWRDVLAGARSHRDGRNLIFHEFAHQIDYEFGATQGVMFYRENRDTILWPKTILNAARQHTQDIRVGRPTVLDSYGATNLAEFFAVSLEAFMEQPKELKREYPDYFEQLREQLGINPGHLYD